LLAEISKLYRASSKQARGNPMDDTPQKKGGRARAQRLTPEKRSEIARQGGLAKRGRVFVPEGAIVPKAIAIGVLPLADIPCAVLDNEENTRVLTQAGFLRALDRFPYPRSAGPWHLVQLPAFLRARNLEPFISNDLITSSTPIVFDRGVGGSLALGYKAQLLPKVCWVYHEAEMRGVLSPNQMHIGHACTILLKGLTDVAIDALVDEATGFQDIRARNALIKLLEKYVSKEALPWVKTFDDDFYKEMFRIHGYSYDPDTVKRPMIFAKRTEDIYNRLAPGAREKLQMLVRRGPSGRPTEKLFQHLTQDEGYQALKELLHDAKLCMKLSSDPRDYLRKLDRIHPRFNETIPLPLE
jgi:hypothetical protein